MLLFTGPPGIRMERPAVVGVVLVVVSGGGGGGGGGGGCRSIHSMTSSRSAAGSRSVRRVSIRMKPALITAPSTSASA